MKVKRVSREDLMDFAVEDFTFSGIWGILGEWCLVSEDGYIYPRDLSEIPLGRLRYPEDFLQVPGDLEEI